MLVNANKWDVYMSFSEENIFSEQKGMHELVHVPVTKQEADTVLANKVISLLEATDFQVFKDIVTKKALY